MIEREKELLAELVREGKLNQDNYLIKDGSLEYRPTQKDKADKKSYQTFKNNYSWVLGGFKEFQPRGLPGRQWETQSGVYSRFASLPQNTGGLL